MKQAFFLGLVVLIIALIVSFAPPASLSDTQAGASIGIGQAINTRLGKSVMPANRIAMATRDALAKKLKTAPPKETGARCDATVECKSGLYCISRDAQGRVRFDAVSGGTCTALVAPGPAPVQAAKGEILQPGQEGQPCQTRLMVPCSVGLTCRYAVDARGNTDVAGGMKCLRPLPKRAGERCEAGDVCEGGLACIYDVDAQGFDDISGGMKCLSLTEREERRRQLQQSSQYEGQSCWPGDPNACGQPDSGFYCPIVPYQPESVCQRL